MTHLQDPDTGEINKDNFVAYSLERKLLDAQESSARRKKMKKETTESSRRERLLRRQASFVQQPADTETQPTQMTESVSLFCCVRPLERDLSPGDGERDASPAREVQAASQEKIAAAFRKFDKNGDGVIDWDEFQQVSDTVDLEQLRRIFDLCDINGDSVISLDEFQFTAGLIRNVPNCL